MNVVVSIAEHELEMADRWFSWVIELGGTEGHHLYIIPVAGVDIKEITPKAQKAFANRLSFIKDEEGQTSDWQLTEALRSASGPNSSFRQVAWHFYHAKLGPYFWCELDCIPLRKDWLTTPETQYKLCGKPFMGAHVEIPSVPEHMSGNAIYVNVPEEAPGLIQRTNWTPRGQTVPYELAFDIAGARQVLPKAHFTNLIQHKFRFKGFESRAEFDAVVDPNAVVFHSDKSGTIYKYLRQNLSGGIVETQRQCVGVKTLAESQTDSQFEPEGASSIRDIPSAQPSVANRTFTPDDELETVIAQSSVIRNGLPAMSPPWENREDTENDVKMLCNALALFCSTTVYKGRVRQALRKAKIIK